jgi:diaminopimelate epimerase
MHNLNISDIEVLPHRCCWHDEQAKIHIEQTADGWQIGANPVMLFDGVYRLQSKQSSLAQTLNKGHGAVVPENKKLVV